MKRPEPKSLLLRRKIPRADRMDEAIVKIHPVILLHKVSIATVAILKPLGIWGLGGLALIDSGFFPLPTTMDGVVIGYVAGNHALFFAYCLMAAVASAIGSLIPYYVGRAGGEIFLLKRINRERYEKMRDRFENQEFLAIMIPAMLPPPTPIKAFEFAAGVFEMKPMLFATAIFCGKFIQFMACALITIFFGPALMHSLIGTLHEHLWLTILVLGLTVVILIVYVMRRVFARKRGTRLPIEEDAAAVAEADNSVE